MSLQMTAVCPYCFGRYAFTWSRGVRKHGCWAGRKHEEELGKRIRAASAILEEGFSLEARWLSAAYPDAGTS